MKRGAVSINKRKIREIEHFFRDTKSLLDTRPIFHHWDATIMGHVFVSFLALLIKDVPTKSSKPRESRRRRVSC